KTGFCTGSVVRSDLEREEFVEISCEIYNPEAPVTEEGEQQPDQRPGKSSQRHQEASSLEAIPFTPYLGKTVGWVKVLSPSTENTSCQKVPEREHTDRKPAPSEAVEPTTSLLDITNPDGEKIQIDKPNLTKLVNGPVILPFPEELSLSDTCPGKAKKRDPTLETLLARKPTKE
ncbi:FETUB protein, partial [Crypturellus undulatus]|nr:FETUB protein [Crypturellus undulatus]